MGIFFGIYYIHIYLVYFFYLCLGRQRANNFRGKQLSCAALRLLGPILCVFCAFVSCTCAQAVGRGAWHFRCSLCFMYILCVCGGEGKAALAAAIRSAVTKIFCPKTLSSVNIYGAIAVHPPPLPSLLFFAVLTHGNENFQQNLCQGRRGMPQQSTTTTNQTNGK